MVFQPSAKAASRPYLRTQAPTEIPRHSTNSVSASILSATSCPRTSMAVRTIPSSAQPVNTRHNNNSITILMLAFIGYFHSLLAQRVDTEQPDPYRNNHDGAPIIATAKSCNVAHKYSTVATALMGAYAQGWVRPAWRRPETARCTNRPENRGAFPKQESCPSNGNFPA